MTVQAERKTHSEIVIDSGYGGLNPVQFGYESCASCHSFGPAVRTHWLLHYVVSGFGSFTREGVVHRLGPGQIFVIPPYMETFYEADKEKPWQYIWIGFTTKEQLPEVFLQPVILCPDAGEVFEEMKCCADMESGKSAFLSGCLWKLTALFLERGKQKPDYVDKALNCMYSEYAQGITVQEIADRLGLNRSYFSELFSKRTGTPPGEYLLHLRLTKAAELMRIYGEHPSTAALSVGYEDVCHFSKIFKKHFGVSPRGYRKLNASEI